MGKLEHGKRSDYIAKIKKRGLPFKVKTLITRRRKLPEPEKGQKKLC